MRLEEFFDALADELESSWFADSRGGVANRHAFAQQFLPLSNAELNRAAAALVGRTGEVIRLVQSGDLESARIEAARAAQEWRTARAGTFSDS